MNSVTFFNSEWKNKMNDIREDLLSYLVRCETLLISAGETFWSGKISVAIEECKSDIDTYYLKRRIVSWYGGMGSFTEKSIGFHSDNQLNSELQELKNKIYTEGMLLDRKVLKEL